MDVPSVVRIVQVINRWPGLREVAAFALQGHGFADSNGGFGVIYSDDLDEYDREKDGAEIPAGCVEIYGFWGAQKGGYDFVVEEADYLSVLEPMLRDQRLDVEAEAVHARIRQLRNND